MGGCVGGFIVDNVVEGIGWGFVNYAEGLLCTAKVLYDKLADCYFSRRLFCYFYDV